MYSEPVRAAYSSYENYALAVLGYSMLRCGVFRMGDFSGDGDHRGFTLRVDADGACTIADSVGVSAVLAGDNKVVTDVGCDIPSISKSVSVHERASRGSTSSIDRVDDGSIGVNDVMGVCHNIPVARDVPGAFGKQTFVGVKGANYERNCVNREKRKNRKIKRQAIQGKNWRRGTDQGHDTVAPALNCGSTLPVKDSGINGFWNSCSEDMRRQLIESKARMHVASNNKKAEEDERRVKQLQSPEQILRDAMRLVNFANDQAKAKNDSKVSGWAKTVAESYAETIAKSAPTSVESFESFVQSNSSITSVSIEAFNEVVKIKDEQLKVLDTQSKTLDTQSRTLDELNKRIAELEVIARSRGNITAKCGVFGKYGEKKPIGNVVTGVSNVKIAQRNTQVAGTIVADNRSARQDFIANSERTVLETAKPERIMSQEHFLKFGKQPGVFFDGKDVFC